jgi:hypothetical protein
MSSSRALRWRLANAGAPRTRSGRKPRRLSHDARRGAERSKRPARPLGEPLTHAPALPSLGLNAPDLCPGRQPAHGGCGGQRSGGPALSVAGPSRGHAHSPQAAAGSGSPHRFLVGRCLAGLGTLSPLAQMAAGGVRGPPPRGSWAHQGPRTRGRRRQAKLQEALEAARAAFEQHPSTQRLASHGLAEWQAWATDRGKAWQRASSAGEGRGGGGTACHRLRPRRHVFGRAGAGAHQLGFARGAPKAVAGGRGHRQATRVAQPRLALHSTGQPRRGRQARWELGAHRPRVPPPLCRSRRLPGPRPDSGGARRPRYADGGPKASRRGPGRSLGPICAGLRGANGLGAGGHAHGATVLPMSQGLRSWEGVVETEVFCHDIYPAWHCNAT